MNGALIFHTNDTRTTLYFYWLSLGYHFNQLHGIFAAGVWSIELIKASKSQCRCKRITANALVFGQLKRQVENSCILFRHTNIYRTGAHERIFIACNDIGRKSQSSFQRSIHFVFKPQPLYNARYDCASLELQIVGYTLHSNPGF